MPGHDGVLVQRRHHQDRRPARPRNSCTTTRSGSGWASRPARACPGRRPGWLLPADEWSGSSYGSVPIGHSVRRHPAADGRRVRRHRQRRHVGPAAPDQGGDRRRTASARRPRRPVTRSVLSPENAAALRTMLEAVTTVDGRHRRWPPRSPATGSPARPAPALRYVDGKQQPGEVGSFIGMAPAEQPRYVVAVFARHPGGEGGDVAAPGVPRDDGLHAAALPGAAVGGQGPRSSRSFRAERGGGTSSVSGDEPPGRLCGRNRTTG